MYRTSEKTSLSRKMAELENRWRKSQEDRYILELKFKEVLKGLANKNEGNKLLKIKEKYNHFLENEDVRNERNDRILRTLDKIESQANMLSAKTERLKLLKLHYEAYMKRMYPTWEKEVNSGEIMVNKDRVYPGIGRHDQRNVYSTLRDEVTNRNENSMVPYSPRQSGKLHVTSTGLQRDLINAPQDESLSNYHIGHVNPGHSFAENIAVQRLNREFSRVGMNPEEKTTSSHGPSFEHEENTSKDLLNVSLSDDNMVNDVTVPADTERTRKGKKDAGFYVNTRPTETGDGNIPLQKNSMSRNPSYQYGKGDASDMFLNDQNRENIGNDNITSLSEKIHSDAPSEHGGRVVRGSTSELQPSLVVTQPTPEIGKSSSEDDVSGKGILVEDHKSKRGGYISSHETSGLTSEAEASEAEGIACESGDDYRGNVKEMTDVQQSPRPTTSFGNNQRNFEEPFQFSSSDADYDELENQMAALVEGTRNDKSKSKPLSQSGHKSVLNSKQIGNESSEHAVDNVGDSPAILSDTAEEEINQQKDVSNNDYNQVIEGGKDDVSSKNVEDAPVDTCLESVNEEGNLWEHVQDSDTFSEKKEDFPAGVNVEDAERGESYSPDHGEEIGYQDESADYARPDEEMENTSVTTRPVVGETYNNQDAIEGDTSGGEGVEHERGDCYYEDPDAKSDGGSEADGENRKCIDTEEIEYDNDNNDGDIDLHAEQHADDNGHLEKNPERLHSNYAVDEQEGEMDDGRGYTQVGDEQEDPRLMKPEHELQEDTWAEEEKDVVESMVHERHHQPEGEQENIELGARNEYTTEQSDREQLQSGEVIEEGDNLEETINEVDDREQESCEALEGQRVDEGGQVHVKEEQEEPQVIGEAEEREFEWGTERDVEGYDKGVTEQEKVMESDVREEVESEIGEYKHDEIAAESRGSLDGSHNQEGDLIGTDEERGQHYAGVHGEETYLHENDGEEKKETPEENYTHDTPQEVEEVDKLQEQKHLDKTDVAENVDAQPKAEAVKEPDVVKKGGLGRQNSDQKELHDANKERAVGGKISQKTTKKEEGKSVKGTKEGERSKEGSQVPSRPLSRQSTRKDGVSPDAVKGEKLKTAIRKFQAKKDTRQTTRRSVDSKK